MKLIALIFLLVVALTGYLTLGGIARGVQQVRSVTLKPLPMMLASNLETAPAAVQASVAKAARHTSEEHMADPTPGSADWRALAKDKLTPEQYNVCFLRGTEPPGSGKYEHTFDPGMYHCAVCGAELFASDTKYDSHSGWPAFWDTVDKSKLKLLTDYDLGYPRTEVRCANCGAHLGHVFDDGPQPTGQRYCINSVALQFVPEAK